MESKCNAITKKNDKILISVHAKPGSKKEGVVTIDEEEVEIAVRAQAQNNKANIAVVEFIADALDVPKNKVQFELGGKSRSKVISVTTDMSVEDVKKKLEENMI